MKLHVHLVRRIFIRAAASIRREAGADSGAAVAVIAVTAGTVVEIGSPGTSR